jgi:hypothetical protein
MIKDSPTSLPELTSNHCEGVGDGMQTITVRSGVAVRRVGRNVAGTACALGLLAALGGTLGGCAEGTSATSLIPSATATAVAPAEAPAPAAPAAAAPTAADKPAKAPEHLTRAQINEQCWLAPEINKIRDLDQRMKLVDKCVDQKSKAQGGT